MATIGLEGLIFHSKHGAFPEENILGARYEIDVLITTSITKAGHSDQLQDTIDYAQIYALIQNKMQERHKLLEYLAYQLAHQILSSDPRIQKVQIKIAKQNPPLGGLCNTAFVEYSTDETS